MALKRGRQGDLGLEVMPLIELALPEPDGQTLLRDRHEEAAAAVSNALATSFGNVSRLQGWWAQYAFEAVVVALGAIRLIKFEDAGLYYFDDADGEIQPPDFRVVLRDGTRLLVEVKSVSPADTETTVRAKDMVAVQRYAEATGGRILYAHYWSMFGIWTLVDSSGFGDSDARRRLSIMDALKVNEMALLGDGVLGIEPPLTLSFVMDPDREEEVERLNEEQEVWRKVVIGDVEVLKAGRTITDPGERKLASFLIWNSRWPVTEEYQYDDKGKVIRVNLVCSPGDTNEEVARQNEAQGMAIIGSLSELNTRRFLQVTANEGGDIRALREEPEPALLAQLVPDDYWDRQDPALPLWRFNQVPATVSVESD